MTVQEIIKSVRWCCDEEIRNEASLGAVTASDGDCTYMDNIIKDKIGDAMRWISVYAPADILAGSDEEGRRTGILVDAAVSGSGVSDNDVTLVRGAYCWSLRMPLNFIKLSRVRVGGWHRAVSSPITEDSDEYLELLDEHGATATNDRPVAALIDKAQKEIELWPTEGENPSVEATFVVMPGDSLYKNLSNSSLVAIPPAAKTSFIYYLAFLLLSAYNDPRAAAMFEIAKINLGRNG